MATPPKPPKIGVPKNIGTEPDRNTPPAVSQPEVATPAAVLADPSPVTGMSGSAYADLLVALAKDLQLDATVDVLPGTVREALANDTATAKVQWIAPVGLNGWTNTGGTGVATVGYYKDPLGFVHLKGRMRGGANGTVAFQLPVGYRPGGMDYYACLEGGNGGSCGVTIDTAGQVAAYFTGSPSDMGLGGITFLAEN